MKGVYPELVKQSVNNVNDISDQSETEKFTMQVFALYIQMQ